jgi:hypothetical protein
MKKYSNARLGLFAKQSIEDYTIIMSYLSLVITTHTCPANNSIFTVTGIVEYKAKCRLQATTIDWNLVNKSRTENNCAKYILIKATRLIRAMYGQKYT